MKSHVANMYKKRGVLGWEERGDWQKSHEACASLFFFF